MPERNWISYSQYGGGLNDNQSAAHIADDEMTSILNFEFTSSDHLKSRNGFVRQNSSPDFTSRITSIFNFITSAGVNNILLTTGNNVYVNAAGVWTSINGGPLQLPTNSYWQWRVFTDLAIGVNQGVTAGDISIVKWSGAGNLAALALTGISGVTAASGAYTLEVFNNRLWVVFASQPNRLYYSTLGNAENWSTSGGFIEIGYNDGDRIEGIFAHRTRLFIFKQRQIFVLSTGQPNTDPAGWNIDRLAGIGCQSRFTIQPVLDDLLFLTDEGVASINAVQEFGDFKSAIISRRVKGLANINLNINTYSAVTHTPKSVYILAAPKTAAGTINNRLYVLDYAKVTSQQLRWTIFESSVINFAVLANVIVNGRKMLFIGGDTPLFHINTWDNGNIYSDENQTITKSFISKAYSFNNTLIRKEIDKIALGVNFTEADLSATFSVRFNEDERLKTTFAVTEENTSLGSLWDTAIWGVDVFSSGATNQQIIERQLSGPNGKRGRTIQTLFSNTQLDQDIVISDIGYLPGLLGIENA